MITPRHQEIPEKQTTNANLGSKLDKVNMIFDSKRRRVASKYSKMDYGPIHMVLDELLEGNMDNSNKANVPKNMIGWVLDSRPTDNYEFSSLELFRSANVYWKEERQCMQIFGRKSEPRNAGLGE